MPNVTFNDPWYARAQKRKDKPSLLTRLMFAFGLAKTEAAAQRVLLVIAILIALVAAGVYVYSQSSASSSRPPAQVIDAPTNNR